MISLVHIMCRFWIYSSISLRKQKEDTHATDAWFRMDTTTTTIVDRGTMLEACFQQHCCFGVNSASKIISTRNLAESKGRSEHKADNHTAIYKQMAQVMWESQRLRTIGLPWPFTGITLPSLLMKLSLLLDSLSHKCKTLVILND